MHMATPLWVLKGTVVQRNVFFVQIWACFLETKIGLAQFNIAIYSPCQSVFESLLWLCVKRSIEVHRHQDCGLDFPLNSLNLLCHCSRQDLTDGLESFFNECSCPQTLKDIKGRMWPVLFQSADQLI